MAPDRRSQRVVYTALVVAVVAAALLLGRATSQGDQAETAAQLSDQSARLGRQNVTINNLTKTVHDLAAQLSRRGSVSQHVICSDDFERLLVPLATDYLDAIARNAPDLDQRRSAYIGEAQALEAALTPGSPTACPALPPTS